MNYTGFPLSLYPPLTLWGWVRVDEKHAFRYAQTISLGFAESMLIVLSVVLVYALFCLGLVGCVNNTQCGLIEQKRP